MSDGDPGARWTEGYLLPLLRERLGGSQANPLVCLQIAADDEAEADRLRAEGFRCDLVFATDDRSELPLAAQAYDFVWTGAFGQLAPDRRRRTSLAEELVRVCRPGGAVMLTTANRACPVDLTGTSRLLHGPHARALTSLEEIEQVFLATGACVGVELLSLTGMFGWSTLPAPARVVVPLLERYLRWSSCPARPKRYAGPFNPMLAVWISR